MFITTVIRAYKKRCQHEWQHTFENGLHNGIACKKCSAFCEWEKCCSGDIIMSQPKLYMRQSMLITAGDKQ